MNYAEMLDKAISESGLSLRQIAKSCGDSGLAITPSYISQLRNGKLPPPNPEVTTMLARVCNSQNESRLIFQGYIEKAPEVIKEYMIASSQLNKIMLESLCKVQGNRDLTENAKKFLAELDVLSTIELSSQCMQGHENAPKEHIADHISMAASSLAKGEKDTINFTMQDDSMEPSLPVKSVLYIKPVPASILKSKDIIAFTRGIRTMVRRAFFMGDEILLIPDNKNADIFRISNFDEIGYIGKVCSFRIDF